MAARFALITAVWIVAAMQIAAGTAHAAVTPDPKRYGIIIGNAEYDHAHISEIGFVNENIAAIRDTFINALGILPGQIQTKTNITKTEFELFFSADDGAAPQMAQPIIHRDAEVFVYIVGHGSRMPRERANCADPNDCSEAFILAKDTHPQRLRSSAFSYHRLVAGLEVAKDALFPDGHITVFMESCFSGRTGAGDLVLNHMGLPIGRPKLIEEATKSSDVTVIAAAQSDEAAYWDDTLQRGVFTHFLSRGLYGRADGNQDRQVSTVELVDYLSREVSDHIRRTRQNTSQRPEFGGEALQDPMFMLASLPAQPIIPTDIAKPLMKLETRLMLELGDEGAGAPRQLTRQRVARLIEQCEEFDCAHYLPVPWARLQAIQSDMSRQSSACRAKEEIFAEYVRDGFIDILDTLEASYADECSPNPLMAECRSSANGASRACLCLLDPGRSECGTEAACKAPFQAARDQATGNRSLAPLNIFARDNGACPQLGNGELRAAENAVCDAAFADAATMPLALLSRLANDLSACAQASSDPVKRRLAATQCDQRLSSAKAAGDAAQLADLMLSRECKAVAGDAEAAMQGFVRDAIDTARNASSPAERREAGARIGELKQGLDVVLPSALRRQLQSAEDSLARSSCDVDLLAARRTGNPGTIRDFIDNRWSDCQDVMQEARVAFRDAECRQVFEGVDQSSSRALEDFVYDYPQCRREEERADRMLRDGANMCLDRVQSAADNRSTTADQIESGLDGCRRTHTRLDRRRVASLQDRADRRRADERNAEEARRNAALQTPPPVTTPPAFAPPQNRRRTVNYEWSTDYFGGDMAGEPRRGRSASSANSCANMCLGTTGCEYFTFNTKFNKCFLKNGYITRKRWDTAVSGWIAN